jgi:hypothetical protein
VGLLWVYCGFTVGLPWGYRGFPVSLLWVYNILGVCNIESVTIIVTQALRRSQCAGSQHRKPIIKHIGF